MVSTKPLRKPLITPVTLSEMGGVRYLHFCTEWVQGAMRIARPWKLEIEYTRDMCCWEERFAEQNRAPAHIVQLGLGAASLTKYAWRNYPKAKVTAVEINPQVIAACHQFFKLPRYEPLLNIVQLDAGVWVQQPANQCSADVLQVDLYDALARGPVLDSESFYRQCRACLAPLGMMTVNVFGESFEDGRGYEASYAAISAAFEGRCTSLPQVDAGNRVIFAWLD